MAYIKHEEFWERNEYETCALFADLLFMNVEKFSPELTNDPNRIYLTDEDVALLDKTGVLNRIFRKWLQTAWLNEGDSRHFDGATPRQELAALYPDLDLGRDFITVKLQKNRNEKWSVAPVYFSRKMLKELGGGGVFELGLKIKKMPRKARWWRLILIVNLPHLLIFWILWKDPVSQEQMMATNLRDI